MNPIEGTVASVLFRPGRATVLWEIVLVGSDTAHIIYPNVTLTVAATKDLPVDFPTVLAWLAGATGPVHATLHQDGMQYGAITSVEFSGG